MAMMFFRNLGALLAVVSLLGILSAEAQVAHGDTPFAHATTERLVHLAVSSARMQHRAAELALTKQARPEVHAFAQKMVEYRKAQTPNLERQVQESGMQIPHALEFEHATLLDNVEPLEFIAFSRRWAELQIQALQQEIQIHREIERREQRVFPANVVELGDILMQAEEVRQSMAE